ncbi:DNA repair protein RAD5 [Pleurostoma richardsiae]|uniref:DNA repair protein RAD5 n=1 Tax=Pleurostoma richardsiae TaxID=41990 RepID=A0AA38S913_9PEZI|nr:DNA repair protein RAD5 [Pleurostoma richardsiae]
MSSGQSSSRQPGPSGSSAQTRIDDLSDTIAVQKAIVASLQEAPQSGGMDMLAQEKATLFRLQKELLQVREKMKGKMNDWDGTAVLGGYSSTSGPSTPADVLTPATSSSESALPGQGSRLQRKRNHSTGGDDGVRPEKSRKTTPHSAGTPFTGSTSLDLDAFWDDVDGVIDLTGDDGQYLEQQRKQEEAFKRRKKKIDEDAELARRLQSGDSFSEPHSSASPSTEQTAFDRILGRPPRANNMMNLSQPTPSPLVIDLEDEDDDEYYRRRALEAENAATSRMNSEARHGKPSSSSYHADPSVRQQMSTTENQSPGLPNYLEGHAQRFRNVYSGADSTRDFSRPAPPQLPTRPPPGFVTNLPPSMCHLPEVSASERARQAVQARFGAASSPQAVYPVPGAVPGTQGMYRVPGAVLPHPSTMRPGYLQGGSYNALQAWGADFSPNALVSSSSRHDPLSEIINRTTSYIELDDEGRILNDRIRDYMEDVVNDPRKNAEEIKELLSNIRPDMEIPEEERGRTPDGLRYPLYPHQQLALQWMIGIENGSNKGGILADDMGLGKTISTLALLLSRPPSNNKIKTNLIVGPVSLIKQWESEIAKKLKPRHKMSVLLYHGNTRPLNWSEMRTYDVVLTTYGRLGQQSKRYKDWVDNHKDVNPSADEDLKRTCPLVHQDTHFYRVILDEAQCIKNEKTLAAIGACRVKAMHRWCLTGTPMMNGVHELYSLIRFLRIRPYSNRDVFRRDFSTLIPNSRGRNSESSRTTAMNKLRTVLKAIMLRRMKTSEIDGKPILNLPPKTQETVHAVFSPEEQSLYRDMETRTRTQFNKYLREGTIGKNYSNILTLLLRLRQVCCHPHLNLDVDYIGNGDVSAVDMVTLAKTLTPDVVSRLKEVEAFECPICYDAVADPVLVLPCGHDTCSECFTTLTEQADIRNLQAGNEAGASGGARCPQCRGSINAKNIINYSTFKQVHMPEAGSDQLPVEQADEEEEEEEEEDYSDSDDSTDSGDDSGDVDAMGNLRDFIVNDDEEDEEDAPAKSRSGRKKSKKSKGKGKGKEKVKEVQPHMLKQLRFEARKNKEAYKRYMRYLHKNWETSAKVDRCCELLKKIQKTGEKTIVFSQFTLLLDLLEVPIKHQLKVKYCRYDGAMSRNLRDDAAREFQDPNSSTKIMLVSLKAGNAGLNLTAASQVVIMDPFWNPYIEMQAVDRAHRIGQQRPVQVHRILVQETIEDRIVHLQEEKRKLVDAALDEGESKQLGRLSARELGYLFGVNVRGA